MGLFGKITGEFSVRQYIAHARFEVPGYTHNTIPLFEYLIHQKGFRIVECDVNFTTDNVPVLHHSGFKNVFVDGQLVEPSRTDSKILLGGGNLQDGEPIRPVEDLIKLCKETDTILMLDVGNRSLKNYTSLYRVVKKWGMTQRIIWANPNTYKLAFLDRHLIVQLYGWNIPLLFYAKIKGLLYKTAIISNGVTPKENFAAKYKMLIWVGHKLGFLMKFSVVNNLDQAQELWSLGADLIITDCLTNE